MRYAARGGWKTSPGTSEGARSSVGRGRTATGRPAGNGGYAGRPTGERTYSDRPAPERTYADRPAADRSYGDRPRTDRNFGDHTARSGERAGNFRRDPRNDRREGGNGERRFNSPRPARTY